MKNFILYVLFGCLAFTSCSKDGISFFSPSSEFVDSNIRLQVIDTFSFKMATFKLDSIVTDIYDNILVGRYHDAQFGDVECSGFITFVPDQFDLPDDAVFDSLVINLGYAGYFYNDTLSQKRLRIYELSKKLDYQNGQVNFYNTSDFPSANLIGERTFFPRISKDSITTKLSDSFGNNLFLKIRNGIINNAEELGDYFKGLKISPGDDENASIISFSVDKSYFRFYYSVPDEPTEVKTYDFKYKDFNTNRNHFTKVVCNREGTVLPMNFLNQETEVATNTTGHLAFVQGGEGIVTKFTFPNFKATMDELNLDGDIYKASLKIPLSNDYFSETLFTGDSLRVYVVGRNNEFLSESKRAVVKIEDPEFDEKYISVPVELFLENTLIRNEFKDYGLVLVPLNAGSVTTRLVLNDNNHPSKKAKLNFTYLTYDK
ncbi:MAG: hypothetical protein CFE23_08350 [Flavobacterium sp. BFFFF1]|uniref:DUF4270 family protein n=1 Tax=Flavobacterium sp. BFFFF1 TaxID=2015557 RepID=UPI000BCEA5C9|nr:DUF4270 family protein [Flavobacterium sp. BFFFF1]OYU80720.1 MAG: hypothetical protein CFE23_08350 [Flavobacterium sp. BFFFF1]